jgi:hypothetical protein
LVHLGAAVGGEVTNTLSNYTAGDFDDISGSGKVGRSKIGAHMPKVTER